jgi:hypothetical protein
MVSTPLMPPENCLCAFGQVLDPKIRSNNNTQLDGWYKIIDLLARKIDLTY